MPKLRPLRVGKFVDLEPITPRGLGERRVRAYIPAVRKGDGPRPLLVLFDGQNVFQHEGSFAGGWLAHEAVDQLGRWKPTPPVIVGIDHGNHARVDELSPFPEGKRGGKLRFLADTIIDHLLPRLHSRFDLVAGPTGHFLGGASLGGLAALYMHLDRPDVFGGAIGMSPSLWFGRAKLEAFIRSRTIPARSRIYLDAGALEGDGTIPKLTAALGRHLRGRGWRPAASKHDRRVLVYIDPRGRHNEKCWRSHLPRALRFIVAP